HDRLVFNHGGCDVRFDVRKLPTPAGVSHLRKRIFRPDMTEAPHSHAAPPPGEKPAILAREDGATIAYHRTEGKNPGVIFLGGYRSDMTGVKATALEAHCRATGRAFLRFDYFGHGQSSGAFTDGTIGRWSKDALCALDALTNGPQVLV